MPILAPETDIYPADLLDIDRPADGAGRAWRAVYTRSRHEKELMRRLRAMRIPHYGPLTRHRTRSPRGRMLESWVPLFANYVFLFADASERYAAFTTNCIAHDIEVADGLRLAGDLRRLRALMSSGVPVRHEQVLSAGDRVRVSTGPLAGQEGIVVQRHGHCRLLVAVQFLQQGASAQIEEWDLEPLA